MVNITLTMEEFQSIQNLRWILTQYVDYQFAFLIIIVYSCQGVQVPFWIQVYLKKNLNMKSNVEHSFLENNYLFFYFLMKLPSDRIGQNFRIFCPFSLVPLLLWSLSILQFHYEILAITLVTLILQLGPFYQGNTKKIEKRILKVLLSDFKIF